MTNMLSIVEGIAFIKVQITGRYNEEILKSTAENKNKSS